MKEFLTEDGKRYARYVMHAHLLLAKIPWAGKYLVGALMSLVYGIILKEGAKEDAN